MLPNTGSLEPVISATLQVPYGVTLFDRFVYWTDWGNMSVLRADKYNGTSVEVLTTGVSLLRDLRVFSPQRQPQGGPCVDNGGCEELCLAVSTSQRRFVASIKFNYFISNFTLFVVVVFSPAKGFFVSSCLGNTQGRWNTKAANNRVYVRLKFC